MKKIIANLSLVSVLAVSMNSAETTIQNENDSVFNWFQKPTVMKTKEGFHDTVNTITDQFKTKTNSKEGLDDVVSKIAEQLNAKKGDMDGRSIAITSFVELSQLNKTTNFGRILGESFFNELYTRGFNVTDFRVQKELSINANGEFFISRDVKKLNEIVEMDYALVGTYSQIEEGVLINARIVDTINGKVVASSRVVYNDKSCEIFENCTSNVKQEQRVPHKMRLTTDVQKTEQIGH